MDTPFHHSERTVKVKAVIPVSFLSYLQTGVEITTFCDLFIVCCSEADLDCDSISVHYVYRSF